MLRPLPIFLAAILVCAGGSPGKAQVPIVSPGRYGERSGDSPPRNADVVLRLPDPGPTGTAGSGGDPAVRGRAVQAELATHQKELVALLQQQAGTKNAAEGEELQKRIELIEKELQTLEGMIRLLAEQAKQPLAAGTDLQELQTQTAMLDARSRQAAQRDQEVADAIDRLNETLDAQARYGVPLPAPLTEQFLPTQTNESPLSIYGALSAQYEDFQDRPAEFQFGEFAPLFLLELNDWILLETELEFGLEEIEVGFAQADFIVNDWLTVVAGRFLAPIGFFNERLHTTWINKLPDNPLMFRQVSPADYSVNGLQARGAFYLGASPVKAEYAFFATNGLGIDEDVPDPSALANLGELQETVDEINADKAFGGRIGFWVPETGFNMGASALFNGAYTPDASDDINLWGIDAGYHQGNWDLRFELAQMRQEADTFLGNNIRRTGMYAQAAYRPYDACNWCLQNTEYVLRYSLARFKGIDPADLEPDEFPTLVDLPVDRDQYTLGINYYLYPSLVVKFAYEINHELGDVDFRDNVFWTQLAWGF